MYALQGLQALQGLTLWVEEMNGAGGLFVPQLGGHVPLQLRTYDDHSRRADVEHLVAQLITQERVDLLIGPYSSGLTLAAATVAEDHRKLLWNHGGSSDAIMQRGFRWLINLPTPASRYFEGLFRMLTAHASPGEHVAVVQRARGRFAAEVAAGVIQQAQIHGFHPRPLVWYPEVPDQFPQLAKDLAAVQPAIIVGVGRYSDDVALARALGESRVDVKALALVAAALHAFREDLGQAAEGCIGPSQWEPSARAQPDVGPPSAVFVERFRGRFGRDPDYPSAQAYAAGLMFQRCVALAGTCADAALLDVARGLDCRTFYGRFQLERETGTQVGHEALLVQWQRAEKRIIWPVEMAEAAVVYPKP
ncbi:MAG: amino acid ABC transporter substrate-binding protein [Nitrospinae bacterium]|nr:amino acid ABC transporter substrate-binding protein [Nitrospinota bacterium]